MKAEQLYQELKDLAEKLGIKVAEKNFRNAGLPVRSGLCKVKEQEMFIMDKHLSIHEKNATLAETLAGLPHESVYVIPAIREILEKLKK